MSVRALVSECVFGFESMPRAHRRQPGRSSSIFRSLRTSDAPLLIDAPRRRMPAAL